MDPTLLLVLLVISRQQSESAFASEQGCLPVQNALGGGWSLGMRFVLRFIVAISEGRLLTHMQPWVDDAGPTFELRMLGNEGTVTVDPENIKTILSPSKYRKGELGEQQTPCTRRRPCSSPPDFVYGQRRNALLPLFGEGLFTQDGSAWKHSRELVRKQFVRIQYNNLEVFRDHVELLISRLCQHKDQVLDLFPLFQNFTMDTTTSLLFGESAETLQEGSSDDFGKNLNKASWWSAIRIALAYLYWLVCFPHFYKACDSVRAYADHWVKKALDDRASRGVGQNKYEFITSLYDELNDRRLVREQLVNVLLAGRDTTAGLMAYVFRLLVRHPDVLARLRKEVESVMGDDAQVDKSKIQKMPWLKCVITESKLEAGNATVLPQGGGKDGKSPLLVPKYRGLGYSPYFMHRRKDLYGEDAHEFKPERWEDGTLHEKIGWGYLPFNGGPRICLGQEFALLETSYVTARIVQTFPRAELPHDEKVVPPGEERQIITITMYPADGCRVRLSE
ncbi:MAG: hypothetical protein Q9162_004835 [Coniocarpon cinnabarinum]